LQNFHGLGWLEETAKCNGKEIHIQREFHGGNERSYLFNPLPPNDIYMSYRTANLQTLHFNL
jgi:hypothetical protein